MVLYVLSVQTVIADYSEGIIYVKRWEFINNDAGCDHRVCISSAALEPHGAGQSFLSVKTILIDTFRRESRVGTCLAKAY